jgi:signal transduction histidine kinase
MAAKPDSLQLSGPRIAPQVVAGALVAFALVIALALLWLQVTRSEFQDLIAYLLISSAFSGALGYLSYRWAESGKRSIRTKIMLAYGVGVAIVILNIVVTAQLMFLSSHDLSLLVLLLVFGAVLSISIGASIAGRMTRAVRQLADGARRVSGGDLGTRVEVLTNDELADLARSFNVMVANVSESEEMLRRAEEARRDLVAAVSHDLRTPLTAIRAMLEALSDGVVDDPETVRRYHETMRAQVTHLARLIDDLFELSQLDATSRPFALEAGDLTAVVRETAEGMAMSTRAKRVAIEFQSSGVLIVSLEPLKIARVVANLLENAVRHAPDGTTVSVRVERQGDVATVAVEDSGPGIDPYDLERIFARFYRGEKSRSRSHGGAGLGLAIARGIVEAHGGTIRAENRAGGGARFVFTIPLQPVPAIA